MKKLYPRKMQAGVRLLLEGMGVNVTDADFRKTPERVARLYSEMLRPKQLGRRVVAWSRRL